MPLKKFRSMNKFGRRRRRSSKVSQGSPNDTVSFNILNEDDENSSATARRSTPCTSTGTCSNTINSSGVNLHTAANLNVNNNQVDNVDVVVSPTAKKFSHFDFDSSSSVDDVSTSTGFRIVSTDFLQSLISNLCCPTCHSSNVILHEDNFIGLSSIFNLYCSICEKSLGQAPTSPKTEKKGAPLVNRRVVLAMKEMGLGKSSLDTFAEVMDFPCSLEKEAFSKHTKAIGEASLSTLDHHLEDVKQKIHLAYGESDPSIAHDKIKNIAVSSDGTWHKRGFSSHYGVVAIVDLLTNLVIDSEVMSNYCTFCSRKQNGQNFRRI
ncbi:hypothetical protein SNE40_012996 [Patella caerulea]|uniref:Mutator-like transposase domain-containing protein n=1 Tax=Patella caerulea TaxID=87958 RepID=A0AAN8JH90_PATCE